jgi:hypothetical protein
MHRINCTVTVKPASMGDKNEVLVQACFIPPKFKMLQELCLCLFFKGSAVNLI